MAKKVLVVIDMQKDFVSGTLGSSEAAQIVPRVVEKVKAFDGEVIFTQDTHGSDYLKTQEGQLLPVEHCLEGTEGWKLVEPLEELCRKGQCKIYRKDTFGSVELAADLQRKNQEETVSSVELIGVCTDICVISNALLIKAYLPQVPVSVDAACCAGVTPKKHECALETMRSCQIIIK